MKRPPPFTAAELQELNRTVNSQTGRRLLWEIHRLRDIALRAYTLQVLITEDRALGRDKELLRVLGPLREQLEKEPVVLEDQERANWRKLRKAGIGR